MKIIHLNTYDTGGAAGAMLKLHKGFLSVGYESRVLVMKKSANHLHVNELRLPFILKWYYRIRQELIIRVLKKKTVEKYNFFNAGEHITIPAKYIIQSLPFKPDIIMLHWVTGFVTSVTIQQLYLNLQIPFVWRFNDLNAFTGGCHYAYSCTNYFTACGKCPALINPGTYDLSYQNLQTRLRLLAELPLTFISSTSVIDEEVRNSALGKKLAVKKIFISGDANIFKPAKNKSILRKKYGLDPDAFIFFFGCQHILDPRKGFVELVQSFKQLNEILSQETRQKIQLAYASKYSEVSADVFPFRGVQLPFAESEEQLAEFYQLADVYISPSIEDAGPMMLLEALLCGTPAIAYNIGLARDLLETGKNGYRVELSDGNGFAKAMLQLLKTTHDEYQQLSSNARNFALTHFSNEVELVAYDGFFKKMLNHV